MAKEYREKVEKELREICYDVLVSFLKISSSILFKGEEEEEDMKKEKKEKKNYN